MNEQVCKVRCVQCAVVMKFVPQSAESQLNCPKCGQRMRVKTPLPTTAAAATLPPRPVQRPVQHPVPRPGAVVPPLHRAPPPPPPAASPAAAFPAELDWNDVSDPGSLPALAPRRPAAIVTGKRRNFGSSTPLQPTSFAVPHGGLQKTRDASGALRLVIKGVLAIGALCLSGVVLLVLIGVVGGLLLGGRAQSKSTVSVQGWSVDAPGSPVNEKQTADSSSKDIYHRTTNSEFSLAAKRVAQPGQSFTVSDIVNSMRNAGTVAEVRPVSRSGLEGFHFTMFLPGKNVRGTAEMFKVDEFHVLLLAYVSAQEKAQANLGKARYDEAKTRELDDPEAFFASLRRGE